MTVFDHTIENVRADCAEWPEAARRSWVTCFDPEDPLWRTELLQQGITPWSRATQYDRARVYTRYLRFVRARGLGEAVSPEGVRAWLDALQDQGRSLYTIASHVRLLHAVAGLLYPGEDWAWLARTKAAVTARIKAAQPPKRKDGQLVGTRDLLRAGLDLLGEGLDALPGEAEPPPIVPWATAQKVRDGLWLILGAHCPERVNALQQVAVHEIDLEAGRFDVPGERVKTRKGSTRIFPPVVAAAIRVYLARVRAPHVAAWRARQEAADHSALWIVKGGGPARSGTMAAAMKQVTRLRLGHAVSPHRLRDAAATYIAEDMPEQAALASVVLQHSNSATTREYTRQAGQVAAFRTIAEHLLADAVAAERRTRATTRSLGCSRAPRGGAPRRRLR